MAQYHSLVITVAMRGIIGESNIWRFALKMQLARFLFGDLSTVWKETHAYSLNGVHLIWRSIRDSPNIPCIRYVVALCT